MIITVVLAHKTAVVFQFTTAYIQNREIETKLFYRKLHTTAVSISKLELNIKSFSFEIRLESRFYFIELALALHGALDKEVEHKIRHIVYIGEDTRVFLGEKVVDISIFAIFIGNMRNDSYKAEQVERLENGFSFYFKGYIITDKRCDLAIFEITFH